MDKRLRRTFSRMGTSLISPLSASAPTVAENSGGGGGGGQVIEEETIAGSSNAVLCLRKAKLSKSLKDIFKLLDAVCHMVDSAGGVTAVWRRNRSLSREVQARVQLYLGQWLSLLYDFRESRNTRSWSSIFFFEYVVEDRQKRNHILDHKHVVRYEQVLQKYYDSTAHLEVTTVAGKLAELLDFFRTHTIDPYSCIIGHRASNTMAAAVSVPDPPLAAPLGAQRSRRFFNFGRRDSACDAGAETTGRARSSAVAPPVEGMNLRFQLVSWCLSIADDQELAYRMRYEAAVLRGVLRLQRGDLALIRITTSGSPSSIITARQSKASLPATTTSAQQQPLIFARFMGQVTSVTSARPSSATTAPAAPRLVSPLSPRSYRASLRMSTMAPAAAAAAAATNYDRRVTTELSFWISPDEGSSISVSLLDVFPIPAALLNEALSYQCTDFDKWAQHPDTPIIDDIQAFSDSAVLEHLDSHGFKIGLLEAQATGTLSLIHCNKLIEMRRELRRLQTSISDRTSSLSGLNEYIDAQKAAYTRHMASLSTREIFHPTASTRADNIASLDPIRISLDTIARYESICSVAIADLEQKKEAILSGKQKQSLVTWWLDKITRDVDDFLVEQYVSLSLSLSLVCVWWTRLDLFLF